MPPSCLEPLAGTFESCEALNNLVGPSAQSHYPKHNIITDFPDIIIMYVQVKQYVHTKSREINQNVSACRTAGWCINLINLAVECGMVNAIGLNFVEGKGEMIHPLSISKECFTKDQAKLHG